MTDFYVSAEGEAAPPVPDGPNLCQGSEMRIVHNAFLWGYRKAPQLVRGVPAGDIERSQYVGTWLGDLDATLHVHHDGEDQLLWDKLEQRAPTCALHVGQMRAHHAKVQALLDEAAPLLASWRASADPETGERLADAYERILAVLEVHLRREVVEVVPVAEKVMTQAEWDALGKHAMGAVPTSRLLPQLGMLLAASSPEERKEFLPHIPGPVRALYRVIGRRQYEKQYRTLFPGEPVPKTR